jgi:hypothetical protein
MKPVKRQEMLVKSVSIFVEEVREKPQVVMSVGEEWFVLVGVYQMKCLPGQAATLASKYGVQPILGTACQCCDGKEGSLLVYPETANSSRGGLYVSIDDLDKKPVDGSDEDFALGDAYGL